MTAPYCVQIAGMPGCYRVRTEHGEGVFDEAGNAWKVTYPHYTPIGSVRGLPHDEKPARVAELLAEVAA